MKTKYSIGEFSRITGLAPKTLRFSHEKGLLSPAAIDHESGYRFYDPHCLDRARVIIALKELHFSLEEIAAKRCVTEIQLPIAEASK